MDAVIMKKIQGKRSIKRKKLTLSDGWRTVFIDAEDIMNVCGLSRSHAHRVINGSYPLSKQSRELLEIKMLGRIPGWEPGWYLDENFKISAPNGCTFDANTLDHFSFLMSIYRDMSRDLQRSLEENKQLRNELKNRTEMRIYVNEESTPSRHIRLVKK